MENIRDTNINYMDPLLYSPAYNADKPGPEKLLYYANGNGEGVRRMVLCTEDAMLEQYMQQGFGNIQTVLNDKEPIDPENPTDVFVRVKNLWVLEQVLAMDSLKNLKGFVIPKAGADNFGDYAEMIASVPGDFEIMPILESRAIFNEGFQNDTLDVFDYYRQQISCVRVGLKDFMSELKLHRDFKDPLYDNRTVATLTGQINIKFGGEGGYPVTAPVFGQNIEFDPSKPGFDPKMIATFEAEVAKESKENNFGKTTVFPNLIPRTIEQYKPTLERYQWAHEALNQKSRAVSKNKNGIMIETAPDRKPATLLLARALRYGVRLEDGTTMSAEEAQAA